MGDDLERVMGKANLTGAAGEHYVAESQRAYDGVSASAFYKHLLPPLPGRS